MSGRAMGIIVGLTLGIVWMWLGFWPAVLVGVLALIGWFIGGVAEGRVSMAAIWQDIQGRGRGLT